MRRGRGTRFRPLGEAGPQDNSAVTSDAGGSGNRSGPETSWFTLRRLRSALTAWRASVRRVDVLVASVLAALALGLGAYLLLRAEAAAHLAFTERAQRLQAAVTDKLILPQENLSALASFVEASGNITRRQFRVVTFPMLVRHKFVYAFEWLPSSATPSAPASRPKRAPGGSRTTASGSSGPTRNRARPAVATRTCRSITWSRRASSRWGSTSPPIRSAGRPPRRRATRAASRRRRRSS